MRSEQKQTPSRRKQTDRSREARNKILNATIHLLVKQGYLSCSIASVAKEAGFTAGAVQHHFTSKAQLLNCVITERVFPESKLRTLSDIANRPIDERCFMVINAMWEYYGHEHYTVVWEIILATKDQKPVQETIARFFAAAREKAELSLIELFPDQGISASTASSLVTFLSSHLRGLSLSRTSDSSDIDIQAQLILLSDTLVLMLDQMRTRENGQVNLD